MCLAYTPFTDYLYGLFMQSFIVEFKDALSADFCQQLINKFEAAKQKQPGRTGAGVDKSKKDSTDLYLSTLPEWKKECDTISQMVLQATMAYARQFPFILTGAVSTAMLDPVSQQPRTLGYDDVGKLNEQNASALVKKVYRPDDINMQRYTKGQGGYHHWHSEHYPHPSDANQKSLHRVLLWLLYLNDVEEGGETEFYYQNRKVKPKKGTMVIAPAGFTHSHRGNMPKSCDKYIATSWIMFNRAEQLYGVK